MCDLAHVLLPMDVHFHSEIPVLGFALRNVRPNPSCSVVAVNVCIGSSGSSPLHRYVGIDMGDSS